MLLRAVGLLLLAACLPPAALAQTPAPTTAPVRGAATTTGPVRVAIAGLLAELGFTEWGAAAV